MTAKVCDVSMTVTCIEDDAEDVKKSFEKFFFGHNVGLLRKEAASVSGPRKASKRERLLLDI